MPDTIKGVEIDPVREKLVDDVHGKLMGLLQRAPYIRCEDVHRQYAVSWLMNNDVTVQEWISVKDRLPEESGEYLTYCGEYDGICILYCDVLETKIKWRTRWKEVTHWKMMPQPPKGE